MSQPIAFRAHITVTQNYTVPVGYRAEFTANAVNLNAGTVRINGVIVGSVAASTAIPYYPPQLKPLTANAGDVISQPSSNGTEFAIVGLLFPVS